MQYHILVLTLYPSDESHEKVNEEVTWSYLFYRFSDMYFFFRLTDTVVYLNGVCTLVELYNLADQYMQKIP